MSYMAHHEPGDADRQPIKHTPMSCAAAPAATKAENGRIGG